MNKGKRFFILKLSISTFILFFLFHRIGFKEIFNSLLSINPMFFIAILFCLLLSFFINGCSVWFFLKAHSISLYSCIKISALSWAWGVFTPGRLGELTLIAYLKKFGVSTGFAGYVFMLTRIIILLYLFAIALIGSYWLLSKQFAFILLIFMFLFLLFLYFLFRSKLINAIMRQRFFNQYEKQISEFIDHVKQFSQYRLEFFSFSVMQLVKILLLFYMTKLVFSSLGTTVNYFDVCFINSIARFTSLVPISINGLGVKEGIQIYMFNRFSDIPMQVVASMGIVFNVIIYLSAFVCVVCLKSRKA